MPSINVPGSIEQLLAEQGVDKVTVGGIILHPEDAKVCMVQTIARPPSGIYLSWPKGGADPEKDSNIEDALWREIEEETGLRRQHLAVLLQDPILDYYRTISGGRAITKHIILYLLQSSHSQLKPQDRRHPSADWYALEAPLTQLHYQADRDEYGKAFNTVTEFGRKC